MMGLTPQFGYNYALFKSSVAKFGTDEQKDKYFAPEIKGLFAQTEVQSCCKSASSIETKATFDATANEFVLKIPNSSWLINLGKQTVNHCVVFARLIVKDKDYGVHAFIVKLRDVSKSLRHDEILKEKLNKKFQQAATEAGISIASVKRVRIPRENMLSRMASVSETGLFDIIDDSEPRSIYGLMMLARAGVVFDGPQISMSALKIALRFGVIRRNTVSIQDKNGKKVKVPR